MGTARLFRRSVGEERGLQDGKNNRYELDGEVLEIPLRWEEYTKSYAARESAQA